MLIDFKYLFYKYNIKPLGLIHCGAHFGEEITTYYGLGIREMVLIEPIKKSFDKLLFTVQSLKEMGINDCNFKCYNVACGEENKQVEMYVESENDGQSNSILKPDKHLHQHPSITFAEPKETVILKRLDDLDFDKNKFNFLSMDCQGYEGYVLRGATDALKNINYVYTEVNRDSVYENCTLIEEMDNLLSDFKRVETTWVGNWGDSFYLRKTLS